MYEYRHKVDMYESVGSTVDDEFVRKLSFQIQVILESAHEI